MRLWAFLRDAAPAAAEYTLGKFVKDLYSHGLLFLGERDTSVELSPGLTILHGEYATKRIETTLQNTLEMFGFQRSVIVGHVHRIGQTARRGQDYDVEGFATGCLCKLNPHYSRRRQNWQHGIALAYYDPNGRGANIYNIRFHSSGGKLRAYWGGKEYTA